MKRARGSLLGVLLAASWLGCNAILGNKDAFYVDPEDSGASLPEGAVLLPDGGVLLPDGNVVQEDARPGADGSGVDGAVPDGTAPDGDQPDATVPEGGPPDTGGPDPPPDTGPDAPSTTCPGCQVLATSFRAPRALTLDGSYLYYAVRAAVTAEDEIWRVPRDGSGAPQPITTVASEVTALAVGGSRLYFAIAAVGWSISSVPVTGGNVQPFNSRNFGNGLAVTRLGVHQSTVIWNLSGDGTYWACGTGCSTSPPSSFFVSETGGIAGGFDVSGTAIYFGLSGKIGRCPVPPTNANCQSTLYDFNTDKTSQPGQVIVRSGRLFWTEGAAVTRVNSASASTVGGSSENVMSAAVETVSIEADANHLYWANSLGMIQRKPVAGGFEEMVASEQGARALLALDGTHVYWLTNNALVRRPKP